MAVSVIFWTTVNAFDTPSDERVLQAPNGASRDRHQCVLAGHLARALDRTRWLPQTTCAGLRSMLRQSSAAVATSRAGHRSPRSDQEVQHRRPVLARQSVQSGA